MKVFFRFLLKTSLFAILFMAISYGGLSFFAKKVNEDYQKLVSVNGYALTPYKRDLYTMCMLDYHINPNGKDMLKECNKLSATIQKKPKTPYYDFYMNYLRGIW